MHVVSELGKQACGLLLVKVIDVDAVDIVTEVGGLVHALVAEVAAHELEQK